MPIDTTIGAGTTPLPGWLPAASRVNLWLLRLGLPIGTQHILTIRGRRTGRTRSTPVSVVSLDGGRYLVSGEGTAWVANARASGAARLTRSRRQERVRLVEIEPDDRAPVLRAFWHQVPHGRPFIAMVLGLEPDATEADFATAAPRCPVFRVDPPA